MILKKNSAFNIAFTLVFAAGLFFSKETCSKEESKSADDIYKNIDVFNEVINLVEKDYVETEDTKTLINNAIKGMVQSLDPHSSYMTKSEYDDLLIETEGKFFGIGIQISIRNNVLTVIAPIEDTPAYKAGIKAGDKIIKIGDKFTLNMTQDDAVKLIRGPKGTDVRLTISREGVDQPLVFTMTRAEIPLKTVKSYNLGNEIGYLRISSFDGSTYSDMVNALNALEKKGKLKGLIMDLRNDPGGLLNQAILVSNEFLDPGLLIVSTRGRDPKQDIKEYANKNKTQRTYPIIVMVNGGSASASEIVAGALQDNKRALILGTRTFGKGSVQTILPLPDGSGLRLTTARYYTPSGRSIQVSGITPDIELEFVALTSTAKENETEENSLTIREENLKSHMENPNPQVKKEETEKQPSGQGAVKGAENEEESKKAQNEAAIVKALVENDNQVHEAIQLLKSWEIISHMKIGG